MPGGVLRAGCRSWRAVAAALVAALAVLVPAAPASAHASLVSTDPADGSLLDEAPSEVVLTFNEPVRLTAQAITVYDATGQPVASDASASGTAVTVDLAEDALGRGTYVMGWFVVSADGHPVSGSLTFSVGERSDEVVDVPAGPESSRWVDAVLGVTQAVTYAGLLVATGLAVFVALVLPHGTGAAGGRARRRLRRVARVAAAVAAVGALVLVPLASVRAQGLELAQLFSAFEPGLVHNEVTVANLFLVGLGLTAVAFPDGVPDRAQRAVLLAAAGVAAAGPALAGHTRSYQPEWLLLLVDTLHLWTGAAWLGGLVGLALTLPLLTGRERDAAELLSRFSTTAAAFLVVVAVTGSVQAWRILGSWSALVETTYGRLLLAKLGIVLVVVAAAAWNRFRLLPGVRRAATTSARASTAAALRRTVSVEAVLLLAVLGVTGFLVNTSPRPAPVEAPAGGTGVQDGSLGELTVLAAMSPRQQGPNTVLVQLQDEAGEPVELERDPVVELRSGDLDLGRVPVTHSDAGTYRAFVLLPRAGRWEVQVSVRQSRFENPVTTLAFDVAEVR